MTLASNATHGGRPRAPGDDVRWPPTLLTPDQNRRLAQLFGIAAELPAAERPAFCARECPGEPERFAELASLLAVLELEDEDGGLAE